MKKTYVAVLIGLGMVLAACGQSETADVVAVGSSDAGPADQAASSGSSADPSTSSDDDSGTQESAAGSESSDSTESDDPASDQSSYDDDDQDGDEADETGQNTGTDTETDGVEARLGTLRSVLLEETLDETSEISSARFEGRMTMVGATGSQLEGELSIVFSGGYDLANEASEVSVDLSGIMAAAAAADPEAAAGLELFSGFFQDPMQVITVGDKSWMKWGLISLLTGAGDMWIEGEDDQTSDLTTEFGFGGNGSPTGMLDLLADANAEVVELGVEEIRGVQTTHYRATIDTEALASTMSAAEQAELATELGAESIAELPMEFWIDADGLLHRYMLDISQAVMDQEGETEFAGATFVFEMWDHGADLGITPPPADEILTEDEITLDFSDFDLAS